MDDEDEDEAWVKLSWRCTHIEVLAKLVKLKTVVK